MSNSRIVCVCVRVRMYVLVADLFLPFPLGSGHTACAV